MHNKKDLNLPRAPLPQQRCAVHKTKLKVLARKLKHKKREWQDLTSA